VRASVAGLAAVTALGSCSRDTERAAPGATVPTTARVTTTTDPYAVPPVIDVAYVNKVLGALDGAYGEVVRSLVSTGTVSPGITDRLKAIYADDLVQLRLASFEKAKANGFSNYRSPPGDRRTVVTELSTADGQCVFAHVSRDYSAVTSRVSPEQTSEWVTLVPKPGTLGRTTNSTPWILTYDGFERDGRGPTGQCR
jgi:hypothetical protein